MTRFNSAGKYLLAVTSLAFLLVTGIQCKCSQKQLQQEAVKEYPAPSTDANTDSLRRVLDEQRAKKLSTPQKP